MRRSRRDERASARWDRRVESWQAISEGAAFQHFQRLILEEANLRRDDVVCDLGCGTGLLALAAAPRCVRVVGVDSSAGMLLRLSEEARRRSIDNVEPLLADMRSVPLPSASVDVAVSSYAFHHLSHADKLRALHEARRMLRRSGRLVVVDMMFQVSLRRRDRGILREKVILLAGKGPAGWARLLKNGVRFAAGRWEQPAALEWWQWALEQAGFVDVRVTPLLAEAGLASATAGRQSDEAEARAAVEPDVVG